MGQTETKEKIKSKKQSSRIRTNFEIDLVSSKNEKNHKKNKKSYYQDLNFQKQVHNTLMTKQPKKLANKQKEIKSSSQLKTIHGSLRKKKTRIKHLDRDGSEGKKKSNKRTTYLCPFRKRNQKKNNLSNILMKRSK
ncbi:hypothetical protein M0813_05926 [Anaeramoeba flamelloides]|uniref:Uncharacterized protein n=1 Tax=Anaeramoeba flamelloides TaxID=1746091 RepID=A0ABQ8XIG9_9EUKA|nr:hypothetical protein M0813_05926 [Anaeramoeba flamelloides]